MSARGQRGPPDVYEDANMGVRNPPSPPHEAEGGGGRRDENSISFRHFLQPQSDVVPTRHRPQRSAVDLVDIPMGLPDFVQDHMLAEAHGDNGMQPLDLEVLHEVLPDFTPAPSSSQQSGRSVYEYGMGLEEAGAHGSISSGSQVQPTPSLPDFLSDGPMHYDTLTSIESNANGAGPPSSRGGETRSESHLRSSSFDTDSLTHQVERLRRELIEKSRRITHLENEVSRQENEISGLQEALANATWSSQSSNERASMAEAEVTRLSSQLSKLQENLIRSRVENGRGNSVPAIASLQNGHGHGDPREDVATPNRLSVIATNAELLVQQLMDQVNSLKKAIAEENREKNGSK